MDCQKIDSRYIMGTYKKKICLEKGEGRYVYDSEGKKYLDFIGGIGTCTVGHSDKDVVDVISKQAKKIINASNLFYSMPQILLAEKLSSLSGLDKCFFSNSGSEAIETAIKLARKFTKKSKVIAMKNGFHGRTLGSLSATWNQSYKKPFEPLVSGFEHVNFGDIEELEGKIDENTAAVMVEPIQGEAGVIIPRKGYLKDVEKQCKENKALFIVDEAQTGNGRTGKYFCFQHDDISPDIITLAKGIANGLPLGVTITKNEIDFGLGEHGSTFGGNSLCCTAALKTIGLVEKILPGVEEKGEYFLSKLKAISSDKIKEVRGKGLMVAVELMQDAEVIVDACAKKGLLINCVQKKNLRFLPPLTVTRNEIDLAVEVLESILTGGDGND